VRKSKAALPVAEMPLVDAPTMPPAADDEHVILQLPIMASRLDEILLGTASASADAPLPYNEWQMQFMSCVDSADDAGEESCCDAQPTHCFWCCHAIAARKFGMPIDYDAAHRMFTVTGAFCSLQCAAAHNMATHMGSDRMWDVHGWIQLMAKMHGVPVPVRPAPSRYVLRLFGGPMGIDEFRVAHGTASRTMLVNMPPLVSVQPQVEMVNTSFLANDGKVKLSRKKSVVDHRKTLEAKMNLSYDAQQDS
jgi:hypothetical protein